MSQSSNPSHAINACVSCKQRKRKCDKVLPNCSTCTRVGRLCLYEDGSSSSQILSGFDGPSSSSLLRSDAGEPLRPFQGSSPGFLFNASLQVDPFRHEALRKPTVDVAVSTEASKILRTVDDIRRMAERYFVNLYTRMPILSRRHFYDRLPAVYTRPNASFITLCLAMNLVTQNPDEHAQSMQSSAYVMAKGIISLLEATNVLNLDVVQARLLVGAYEMGHSIHPADSISIGACGKAARFLGLNKKAFQNPSNDPQARLLAEEEKRVWWGVHNLDRYINLCNGDALFATEDPLPGDLLPIDDKLWAQDIVPETSNLILATPSDITVGSLARECQISHLVGRVLRHVYDPTPDPAFHVEESLQLERTLLAFLPLLIEEERKYGLYCAAMGMASSALFTLYDAAIMTAQHNETERNRILQSLETTADRIADFSSLLFGDPGNVNFDKLSPFVPHSIYQAAIVQLRIWKETHDVGHKEKLDSLKTILGYFNRRWVVAGKYLVALETLKSDWPITMFPLEGFSISARGPIGENTR